MCGHRRRGTHLFLADPRDQGSRRNNKLESFDGYIVCGIGAETETPPSGMSISETSPGTSKWYETERNTEALVKAVMAARPVRGLSGDDVWWLLQLTWITTSKGHTTKDHWQKLKVPALAHLFKKK